MEQKFNILGVKISATNLNLACRSMGEWIKQKKKAYVCIAPVSTIVDCQKDEEYLKIVNQADMVTPDGMPLVWLAKLSGLHNVQRTYGPDLMLAFSEFSQQKGYKHFFYGGTPQTCQLLEEKLRERFPQLKIAGTYAPPFQSTLMNEEEQIIEKINQSQPDVLWVGLGSPKQDYWMVQHRQQLNVPVMVGVGAAFDFISGVKKQAPWWMQKCGLEWFFRLCCEPKRLWKRYAIGNFQFIYYLVQDSLKRNRFKKT